MVLCILNGAKGKGQFYNEIKRFLFTKLSIPSQVILLSTILKGKNLRSIYNKVFMQICAKVGGEPWIMDEMPFTDVPTCVISIDFYDKGSHPVMAVVLSVNKNFSKFCSIVLEKDGKIEVNIRNAIYNAIDLVNYK
jgi:aubergine-like protein